MTPTDFDMRVTAFNARLFVRCLVAAAKVFGYLLPFRNASSLFFFFPFHHVGGAEKVHAAIVTCLSPERPWVFFTKKSQNRGFLPLFGDRARLFNAWFLLKYGYPLSVGVMAGFINRHRKPVVFGSNSLFFYLMLPYLHPKVKRVDLLHAFGGGAEDFSLPVVPELDARVVINRQTHEDLRSQYSQHGLPRDFADRIVLIENQVPVPAEYPAKPQCGPLKILYVGRGTEEKRVHLVGRIAASCMKRGLPAEFLVIGNALDAVAPEDRMFCTFLGELADSAQLSRIYADAAMLLITSSREGFPMVIMEGMAHGVVPLSTHVGGISVHVRDGVTGWLVENVADEGVIVAGMCRVIEEMCSDRAHLAAMSRAAYDYARMSFGGEKFCSSYRTLLHGSRGQR